MSELIKLLKDTKKHLMTGVSYMIPFVVAGGILLAVSVLLSGSASVPDEGWLKGLAEIGSAGLGLMVPILAGFIAYSMADRSGLAPGIIGGLLANEIGAGFIGGIIAGILAGIVVFYIKKIKVPSSLRSLMPIFIIPLLSTIIVGGLMVWAIGIPIASLMTSLTAWLEGMGSGNKIILGLILGAMIGVDMGGPINKVAFGFGTAMVATIDPATGMPSAMSLQIMAAIGVAICVPPISLGVASLIAPKKYTVEEREAGKAGLIMGLIGITEGAIPFAAADPIRVIPSIVTGSSIGAAVTLALGAGNPAPWGGWIVLPVTTSPLIYVLGTVVGIAVTVTMVNILKPKKILQQNEVEIEEDEDEFDLTFENF